MDIKDEDIIEACNNSVSMASACAKLGMNFKTFSKRARALEVYKPNPAGCGINKKKRFDGVQSIDIKEILEGKHPQYQSNKLRIRLIREGYKEHKCEICNNSTWNDMPISLELNHIDGNRHNHLLDNLEIICPNCHAQTETYRAKNMKSFKEKRISG